MDPTDFIQHNLPDGYLYEVCEYTSEDPLNYKAVFHVNIMCLTDLDNWICEYSRKSLSNWNVRDTHKKLTSFIRKDYVCHMMDFKHRPVAHKKSTARYKHCDCPASMTIRIKYVNKNSVAKYPWVKAGMPATVNLKSIHNHPLCNAEALSFRKMDPAIKDTFKQYFSMGLSAATAIEYHLNHLEMDPDIVDPILTRADAAINPSKKMVEHLYGLWRKDNFGSRHGEGMLAMLEQKIEIYAAAGSTVLFKKEPFALVIVTPIMRRAHEIASSRDIAFVDSTCSCDSENHVITFLMLASAHGAVPGGVMITEGQRQDDYVACFSLLMEALGVDAFGGCGHPAVFMTDDSAAEQAALTIVWPESVLKLCHFHILQAVWRWLCDSKHSIAKEDRRGLMTNFQKILHALTEEDAKTCFTAAVSMSNYENFSKYLQGLWERRVLWAKAWRNVPGMRGHHTNNFCEISVRLFKDHILTRCKAYNVIALTDFVVAVMERFYRNRLERFANGRISMYHILMEKLYKKSSYITESKSIDVVISGSTELYMVPSQKVSDHKYEVYPTIGSCSCSLGMSGGCCKHQVAVHKFFGTAMLNAPPVTSAARYEAAYLALGDAAPNISFYASLSSEHQNCNSAPENNHLLSNDQIDTSTANDDAKMDAIAKQESNENVLEEWKKLSERICNKLIECNSNDVDLRNGIKKMKQRFDKVHTFSQLCTFFHSSATQVPQRYNANASIRTQPTAAARRKQPNITRGAKRQLGGRPAAGEKRALKRRRCLAENIKQNVPHAKSHGKSH